MKLKLYNAKFQYTGNGIFSFLFSFEDEKDNPVQRIKSTALEDVMVGDSPIVVAQQLRLMADRLEEAYESAH